MQSLVLAGNFRELSQDELFEVNGGSRHEVVGTATGAGALTGWYAVKAGAKKGAKIGAWGGLKGAAVGAIVGGVFAFAGYEISRRI